MEASAGVPAGVQLLQPAVAGGSGHGEPLKGVPRPPPATGPRVGRAVAARRQGHPPPRRVGPGVASFNDQRIDVYNQRNRVSLNSDMFCFFWCWCSIAIGSVLYNVQILGHKLYMSSGSFDKILMLAVF